MNPDQRVYVRINWEDIELMSYEDVSIALDRSNNYINQCMASATEWLMESSSKIRRLEEKINFLEAKIYQLEAWKKDRVTIKEKSNWEFSPYNEFTWQFLDY